MVSPCCRMISVPLQTGGGVRGTKGWVDCHWLPNCPPLLTSSLRVPPALHYVNNRLCQSRLLLVMDFPIGATPFTPLLVPSGPCKKQRTERSQPWGPLGVSFQWWQLRQTSPDYARTGVPPEISGAVSIGLRPALLASIPAPRPPRPCASPPPPPQGRRVCGLCGIGDTLPAPQGVVLAITSPLNQPATCKMSAVDMVSPLEPCPPNTAPEFNTDTTPLPLT